MFIKILIDILAIIFIATEIWMWFSGRKIRWEENFFDLIGVTITCVIAFIGGILIWWI